MRARGPGAGRKLAETRSDVVGVVGPPARRGRSTWRGRADDDRAVAGRCRAHDGGVARRHDPSGPRAKGHARRTQEVRTAERHSCPSARRACPCTERSDDRRRRLKLDQERVVANGVIPKRPPATQLPLEPHDTEKTRAAPPRVQDPGARDHLGVAPDPSRLGVHERLGRTRPVGIAATNGARPGGRARQRADLRVPVDVEGTQRRQRDRGAPAAVCGSQRTPGSGTRRLRRRRSRCNCPPRGTRGRPRSRSRRRRGHRHRARRRRRPTTRSSRR